MIPASTPARRRTPRRRWAAIAAAAVIALPLSPLAGAAAHAASGDPIDLWGVPASLEAFAGIDGVLTANFTNNTGADIDDAYVSYEPTTVDSGMRMSAEGERGYDPLCAQPGGVGTTITCGPISVAAGRGGTHTISYNLPSDYLLVHGDGPTTFDTSTTVSSASAGFTTPPFPKRQNVRTDLFMQTTLAVVAPGTPTPSRPVAPASSRFPVGSPQDRDIQVLATQGGYSDVRDVHVALTLPDEVSLRELPAGCTVEGATVDCVWPLAESATFTTFNIPVRIADGLPSDYVIPLQSPVVTATSPHEPANRPSSWTAEVVAAPFSMIVTPSVDLAIAHEEIAAVDNGTVASFPITLDNNDTRNTAVNAHAELALDGIAATGTSIDIPGCTVEGDTHVTCDLGDLAPGTHLSGTLTTTLPVVSVDTPFTLAGSIASDTPEIDERDNSFLAHYTIAVKKTPIDPSPAPIDPSPAPIDPSPAPIDPSPAPVDPSPAPINPSPAPVPPSATGPLAYTGGNAEEAVALVAFAGIALLIAVPLLVISRRRRLAPSTGSSLADDAEGEL